MMWAVLAAALAAVFLLGGLCVGLRGEYTPETAGAWLRIGPAEVRIFPRPAGKRPDRPKETGQDRPSGKKKPRPTFLSRRGLLELGRRLFPLLLEAARAYRFSAGKTARLVYAPSALPYFAAGCSTGMGLAWKAGVAAEVLCRPAWAVGTQIVQARDYLETPSLFAWTLVILLLSLTLEKLLSALLNRINRRWSP